MGIAVPSNSMCIADVIAEAAGAPRADTAGEGDTQQPISPTSPPVLAGQEGLSETSGAGEGT